MQEKENVYQETTQSEMGVMTQTGQEKEMSQQNAAPEKVSTDLGKFRSVDALVRAYEALQSEFTRRSQRLKELERETDNSFALADGARGVGGAEKLRKNAAQKRAESKDFDHFVSELESVRAQTEKTPEIQAEQPDIPIIGEPVQDVAESEIGTEQTNAKPSVAGGRGEEHLSDDALYELVKKDEQVRLKIIGEYLASIGKSGAPLMKGGTGTLVAPPLKPKTIDEAGNMALRFFKKESAQA